MLGILVYVIRPGCFGLFSTFGGSEIQLVLVIHMILASFHIVVGGLLCYRCCRLLCRCVLLCPGGGVRSISRLRHGMLVEMMLDHFVIMIRDL